jgi:hypothetical protein
VGHLRHLLQKLLWFFHSCCCCCLHKLSCDQDSIRCRKLRSFDLWCDPRNATNTSLASPTASAATTTTTTPWTKAERDDSAVRWQCEQGFGF